MTADRGDAGRRLDLVLRRHLPDVPEASRTRVQAWIAGGLVTVNGRTIRRVAARAAAGDAIVVTLPSFVPRPPMAAEPSPLHVLYEDAHLLVVNKPAGLVVHPTHAQAAGTLMNALLWHARGWAPPSRPSLVGRLDKLTSGVVVVARTPEMHTALQRAWSAPETSKEYLAVVQGRAIPRAGRIALGLRRDPGDRRRVIASSREGTPSVTLFERIGPPVRAGGVSLLRCRLMTGRTHQIRVHLAASGWPIAGDRVYGDRRGPRITEPAVADAIGRLPGQALHAWRIVVRHPATGETLAVEAPLPPEMAALIAAAGLAPPAPDTAGGRRRQRS